MISLLAKLFGRLLIVSFSDQLVLVELVGSLRFHRVRMTRWGCQLDLSSTLSAVSTGQGGLGLTSNSSKRRCSLRAWKSVRASDLTTCDVVFLAEYMSLIRIRVR